MHSLPGPTFAAPDGSASPKAESSPYIYCPPDVVRDLPDDAAKTFVRIPQPKTNVNWCVQISKPRPTPILPKYLTMWTVLF